MSPNKPNRWLIAVVVPAVLTTVASGAFYSGSLSTADGGLVGTGPWGDGSSLSWTIKEVDGPIWEYTYTLEVPERGISHFIFELSADFDWANIESPSLWINGEDASWTGVDADIDTYGPADPSNPLIPDNVYGIKVDMPEVNGDPLVVEFSFLTLRDPVWGDFYAKGGRNRQGDSEWMTMWNAGFASEAPTPLDPPDDGSLEGHLLVPNLTEIPEPMTLVLVATGGLGVLLRRPKGHLKTA